MYCSKCGVENQNGSKFCRSCGSPIDASPETVSFDEPENEIESDGDDLDRSVEIFVGPNYDYFKKKWLAAEKHSYKYSWNWVAFLFPGSWLAYRKMYLYSSLTILGYLALGIFLALYPPKSEYKSWLTEILLELILGMSCNYWYKLHADKKVDAITDLGLTPERTRDELIKQGGVSASAAVIATLSYAIAAGIAGVMLYSDIGNRVHSDGKNNTQTIEKTEPARLVTGQAFQSGGLEIKVVSVRLLNAVGDPDLGQTRASSGGVFVAVDWQYKNISNKPVGTFSLPTINLVDPNGTEYSPDIGASAEYAMQVNNTEKILSDLNPGITTMANEVFEVNQELAHQGRWRVLVKADRNIMVEVGGENLQPPMPVQMQLPQLPQTREPVVTYSPCIEKGMAKWREQHSKEISKWCDELAKKGEECRISAGQDAAMEDEAHQKITAQCSG